MSSAVSALIPQLANYNPTGFALENQQRQQQLGMNAIQAAHLRQQTELAQQQTQGASLQNQLIQQQIADQKAIGQAWIDWDQKADPLGHTVGPAAIKNGATPQSVMNLEQHRAQYSANLANADKVTLENAHTRADDFSGKIQAIIEADPQDQDNLLTQYKGALLADDPEAKLPDHFGLNEFKALQRVHQYQSIQIEQALKAQQTKEANAKALQAQEETRKAKLTNDLLEKSQQGGDPAELTPGQHPIAAIGQGLPANDPTMAGLINMYNQGHKMPILENGITRYPMSEKAMETMAAYQKTIGEATSSQLRAGKVQTALEENTTLAPFKQQEAVDTATAVERAKAALSPDVFNAIIDPTARNRALNDWTKANTTYQDEVASADKLLQYIQAARSGNQTAAAQIPIAELRSIVSRVTNQELEATGEGLSIGRKISNMGDKAFTGKPTEETLGEYEQLANIMKDTATRSYAGRMLPLQQQGAKVSLTPSQIPASVAAPRTTLPAQGGKIHVRRKSDGQVGDIGVNKYNAHPELYDKL